MKNTITIARRMEQVSYPIRDVVLAARKVEARGVKMHWFNVGDPNRFDFSPAPWIVEAVRAAAADPRYSGYAPSEGDPELRGAIAKREGTGVEDIFITSGLSEGLNLTFQCLMDAGDNILLPSPTYPLYSTISRVLGGADNFYDTDGQWQPDVDDMRRRINERTRAIVVINPNNPTGAVYSPAITKQVIELAGEHDLPIIADEIYDQLCFEGCHPPIHTMAKDVPVIRGNGISKNHFYPGARVGYLALHGEALEPMRNALVRLCNSRLSVNWEMQRGALAAIIHEPDHLPAALAKLRSRRDLMVKRLNGIDGIRTTTPQAAFYIFPQITRGPWESDVKFVYDLLENTGIVAVPGSGFSTQNGQKHFRLVYLSASAEIDEAMDKLARFMKTRLG